MDKIQSTVRVSELLLGEPRLLVRPPPWVGAEVSEVKG